MSQGNKEKQIMGNSLRLFLHPKVLTLLFLGFSAGLPLLLIFSTLSVWLTEAGVARSAVTFFSWAALGYSFKFIWAPLVDLLPLPFLTRLLGRRRSWMLLAQLSIIVAILWMACTNPALNANYLTIIALAAVMLGFSSATQDIVIDAYRIECAEESMQALLASVYIVGYRLAMIASGAGSLFLADYFGSSEGAYNYDAWKYTYYIMAGVMSIGIMTTLVIREPSKKELRNESLQYSVVEYVRLVIVFVIAVITFIAIFFLSGPLVIVGKEELATSAFLGSGAGSFLIELLRFLAGGGGAVAMALLTVQLGIAKKDMVNKSFVEPVKDFFIRYGWRSALLLLLLVGFYRLSDIVLGVVSNVFYIDMGYSKTAIGAITKTYGLIMILLGGLLGGVLTVRFGVKKILLLGACLSSATNLLFMVLSTSGADLTMLSIVVGADNLSAGIATTAFVAFLSSLTSISFTAVQYAIFSSVMTLFPKLIGGYSGSMVDSIGYEKFFLLTAVMGVPVILLILTIKRE